MARNWADFTALDGELADLRRNWDNYTNITVQLKAEPKGKHEIAVNGE